MAAPPLFVRRPSSRRAPQGAIGGCCAYLAEAATLRRKPRKDRKDNHIRPALVAALFATLAAPAHAGRGAPPADWAAIVSPLKAQAYVSWEEIEVDREGNWNVDEARHNDGGV